MRKIYTYEECKERALLYETRKELKNKEPGIYNKINSKKWWELVSHMKRLDHKDVVYTEDICKKIVSNYEFLKDFREKQPRLYALICYHGWHHLLSDLKRTGSANLRTLYAYEFPELNYVYVGLTYNIAIRNQEHHTRGSLYNWALSHNISNYEPKILRKNIKFDIAGKYEAYYIETYRKQGWNLINKAKAGSLGGTILKNDEVVLFTEEGNYIDSGKVDYICEKYNIKRMLLRICLRKRNKTTNEYQIMYKDEWAKNGSPHKIPSQIIKNKKEKIAILTKDFKIEAICNTKSDARKYLSLTSSINCVTFIRKNLICNYKMIPQKWVCYYDDFIKYKNGEYIIFDPKIPKNKKLVFLPKICDENTKNNIIKNCFEKTEWKKRSLQKRKELRAMNKK